MKWVVLSIAGWHHVALLKGGHSALPEQASCSGAGIRAWILWCVPWEDLDFLSSEWSKRAPMLCQSSPIPQKVPASWLVFDGHPMAIPRPKYHALIDSGALVGVPKGWRAMMGLGSYHAAFATVSLRWYIHHWPPWSCVVMEPKTGEMCLDGIAMVRFQQLHFRYFRSHFWMP